MITELSFVECIVCDARIDFDYEIELNELLECIDCGTELEIIGLNPLEVTEVDADTEDWGQ